jgi:hypothetical protein
MFYLKCGSSVKGGSNFSYECHNNILGSLLNIAMSNVLHTSMYDDNGKKAKSVGRFAKR